MGAFKSWLIKNHAAYCVYCGHDVDQDGNAGPEVLHPRGMGGPELQKHLEKFDIKTLHPVVCRTCWKAQNPKGQYPARKQNAPSQKVDRQDDLSTAVTKTYVPELSSSNRKRAG